MRTPTGSGRTRGTHLLSSADEEIGQDAMNKRGDEGRLLPIKRRGRDMSENQENAKKGWTLTLCQTQRGCQRKLKESERARGTHSLLSAQVRKPRESKKVRGTHELSSAEGTSEDTKRKRESEWHSRTVEHSGKDKSGHQKKI